MTILSCNIQHTSSFAISSSSSSSSKKPKKKKSSSPKRKSGGIGFSTTSSTSSSLYTPDTSEETNNLVKFLLSQKSSGLANDDDDIGTEIGFSKKKNNNNNIRGVYSTSNFKKGDILCRIPSDCGLALSDPNTTNNDNGIEYDALNFIRWYQRHPTAKEMWKPYLDTLPTKKRHFDHPTPDFYDEKELEVLNRFYPGGVKMVEEKRESIRDLAMKEGISFNELQFATWIVSSRSFAINPENQQQQQEEKPSPSTSSTSVTTTTTTKSKPIRILLPYIDIINHSSKNPNVELHIIDPEKDDAWFAIRAKRPIRVGKELLLSYGSGYEKSWDLLMNYGFVDGGLEGGGNLYDEFMFGKRENEDEEDGMKEIMDYLEGWEMGESDEELSGNMGNVLRLCASWKASYEAVNKKNK